MSGESATLSIRAVASLPIVSRLFLVALILWASPVQAAITCEAAGAQAADTTDPANLAYTIPSNSNQITFLVVHDRTEALTIASVSGGSCTWTLRAGPFDNSNAATERVWLYEGVNCAAGATTIDVDLSAAGNTHLAAASCWADSAMTFQSAGPSGSETNNTGTLTTESLTPTTTGLVVAGIATNNAVSISSVDTANSDDMTAAASRAHLVRRLESSGSTNIAVTWSGNATAESAVILYHEGAAGGTRKRSASPPPPGGGV